MRSLQVARKLSPGKPVSDERGAGSYGIYMYTTSCARVSVHVRVSVCVFVGVCACLRGIYMRMYYTFWCTRGGEQGHMMQAVW